MLRGRKAAYVIAEKTTIRKEEAPMTVFVISMHGERLMPTTNIKKVRKTLKAGLAEIVKHHPFTIQLLYETGNATQPIELTEDTGYQYIGVSIKSEKHEYVSAEYELLSDEKQHHSDQNREHRRPRRSRKRYRKARFDNRRKPKGWLAPSIANRKDRHVDIFRMHYEVCPITSVTLEMGQFDPAVLDAIEQGKPIPQGAEYQHGPRYGYDTLREAVFARDGYKCRVCGRSAIEDGVTLCIHHNGYRTGDRSNRMANLSTVCQDFCHTPKQHSPGGKLWDLKPPKGSAPATFMNTVRWRIYEEIKAFGVETHITYGAVTKHTRKDRNIEKTHANDAYCIGAFRPKHRTKTPCYRKRRRNNRILEKFYDAKYIDVRNGKKKGAKELGCNRTKRKESRRSHKNERIYRGKKLSKGERRIRRKRYPVQSGDIVAAKGYIVACKGTMSGGESILLFSKKESPTGKAVTALTSKVTVIRHVGGWATVSQG